MSANVLNTDAVRAVADYLISLDRNIGLFNNDSLLDMNGRKFYEGNARLNKYLHLAQNIYYAKTSELLFDESLYAYDNGGVVPEIQENYKFLISGIGKKESSLSKEKRDFLSKIYNIFRNAPINRLIELSHEDPEWKKRQQFFSKEEQRMDTVSNLNEYKMRYADIIRVMDEMSI